MLYTSFESSFARPGQPPKSIRTGYQDSEKLRVLPSAPALFVLTAPRSGTTLTSYLVKNIHDGEAAHLRYDGTGLFESHNERVPWVDGQFYSDSDLQRLTGVAQGAGLRLIYKTHLEPYAVPAIPGARMVIVGRPPADVAVSLWDYFTGIKPFGFAVHDDAARRLGWNGGYFPRPTDFTSRAEFFRQWVHRQGFPFVNLVEIYRQAWALRGREDVLLLHYDEIVGDLPGTVRRIAAFERVTLSDERVDQIVALANFHEMRRHSRALAPSEKRFDTEHHLNQGRSGRGAELFPRDQFRDEYRALEAALGSDCFHWLDKTP